MINYVGYYIVDKFVLEIKSDGNLISSVLLVDEAKEEVLSENVICFKKQCDDYFSGKITSFKVNIDFRENSFVKSVFGIISEIPYNSTYDIKNIVGDLGLSKGVDAISTFIKNNQFLLIFPCHRVTTKIRRLVLHSYSNEFLEFLINNEKI